MRILFTFAGGNGHFVPLLPLARVAAAAGHTVAFGCQPAMVASVERAGCDAFATGGATLPSTPERYPLLRLDMGREEQALREGFARKVAGERAAAILALCEAWRPVLIVCDEIDFGAMVAAEQLGLPHAVVLVIAAGSFVRPALVAEPLDELRAAHGLPSDPELAMLRRYLVLAPFPPSYRDPAFPLPPTAYSISPVPLSPASEGPRYDWHGRLEDRPTVYFTLGTVFNIESGDLFQRVLAGLRELPINVIATLGQEIDPQELGPQPSHIHIRRYLPQAAVLPICDAVISHGGSGSVMGALSFGLPMVLLPMGADQPLNAQRCVALGVGRALDAVDATPEQVREAVLDVLNAPGYRGAAGRLRDEIAALPHPEHALALLERLGGERAPIT